MTQNLEMPISPPGKSSGALKTIFSAWLLAGTLDITVASIYYPLVYGLKLVVLYQGIASGVLGASAFSGGIWTALLGLALHYSIALIWTLFFFLVFPLIRKLSGNPLLTAAGYGIFVSCAMTFVVLPLSSVHHSSQPLNILHFAIDTLILVFTIGTPISTIIGKYYVHQ